MARALVPRPAAPEGSLIRRILWRIATERTTPARLGWAVGLGIIVGTTPFFGFHLPLCLAVATALGLNRAVTYLAANISVPWIAPFLIFGSIQLGSFALEGRWLDMSLTAFRSIDPLDFAQVWLVGSIWLGAMLGLPAGLATFVAVRAFRRRHPLPPDPIAEAMDRVSDRYLAQGRWVWGYVRGKFNHDPIYRQLAERSSVVGPLLDVGCGRGQSALLLMELQPDLRARGLDFDPHKLDRARLAADEAPERLITFEGSASESSDFGIVGTLLLIDVLHYNPALEQDEILRRAVRALKPGGTLLVRDVDAARGWRSTMTRIQERIGRLVGFNRGATLCFRDAEDLACLLEGEGLTVEAHASWAGTPFANVLLVATKPPVEQSPSRSSQPQL